MHCTHCGIELQPGVTACPECGEPIPAASPAEAGAPVEMPAEAEAPVSIAPAATASTDDAAIGWSDKLDDPHIQKMAARQRKSAQVFGVIFGILFPVGFAAAGIFIKEVPLKLALIVGVGLGLLMAIIAFFRLRSLNKPVWEGSVVDKTAKEHTDKKDKTHTDYTVVFKGIGGGKRYLRLRDDPAHYDYFAIGDKVRYYPVFGTYEKRDKSGDEIIFCNVCSAQNSMSASACTRCKSPLFK